MKKEMRFTMRWIYCLIALAGLGWLNIAAGASSCCAANSQEAGACAAPEAKPAETVSETQDAPVSEAIVTLLDKLEARCWNLQSFQAKMVYEKEQRLIDTKTIQNGRLYYQVQQDQEGETVRFMLHFTDLQEVDLEEDQAYPVIRFDEHYFFDGKWVVRRNSRTKTIERWEMSKEPARRETFRLGKGPFPLPFAIRRDDVLKEFDVSLIEDEGKKSKQEAHLRLVPKKESRFAEEYVSLDLWIDTEAYVAKRLEFESTDSQVTTVVWSEIDVDKAIAGSKFDLLPGEAGWTETVHPYDEKQ